MAGTVNIYKSKCRTSIMRWWADDSTSLWAVLEAETKSFPLFKGEAMYKKTPIYSLPSRILMQHIILALLWNWGHSLEGTQ